MIERFWAKVDRSAGKQSCWPWIAGRLPSGYGQFNLRGRTELAHRVAWALTWFEVPDGLCVMHRCDNPPCVNPAHLRLGSSLDNNLDAKRKQRNARGERIRGSKLTPDDVLHIRIWSKAGHRQTDIAVAYGVSQQAISYIERGLTWKHILHGRAAIEREG